MNDLKYFLFDLDGTLTDPKEGICKCVQFALKGMGIIEEDLDKLEPFIGPPLWDSFMQFYGLTREQADKAVEIYRKRFSTIGLFENEIYEGIAPLLKELKEAGHCLAVASSKPTVFVKQILKHFEIYDYFDAIVGSELDGTRVKKEEVVEEALRQIYEGGEPDKEHTYMVGDRKFDVEGAKAFSLKSVGVTYGYGGEEELREAGADYVVASVEELKELLLKN